MNYFSKKLNGNRKGFTLIELIVVIAIIGILVLLAGPKFLGYTKDAQHAKLVHNTKVYEDAATIYHIENGDWPRLTESDVYMTPTELNSYKDAYFDVTGQEVVLDETGHFYQLDWDKLAKYVKEPADSHMYILQNPVGRVFYMDSEPDEFMAYLSGSVGNFIAPEVVGEDVCEDYTGTDYAFDPITGTITDYLGTATDIEIPCMINGVEVTTVGDYAFSNNQLTSVIIPDNIINIGLRSFAGNNITSATLSKNITRISQGAFRDNQLTSITIPDSVIYIEWMAFHSNKLTSVVIGSNVQEIEAESFAYNDLTTITFPDSVSVVFAGALSYNGPNNDSGSIPKVDPSGTWILNGITWELQ